MSPQRGCGAGGRGISGSPAASLLVGCGQCFALILEVSVMKLIALFAVLLVSDAATAAEPCPGGKCPLVAKSKAVVTAPVRTVAKARSVVREHRPILFPRLRGCR